MELQNNDIAINGKFIKIARIKSEGFKDVDDVESLMSNAIKMNIKADIFTYSPHKINIELDKRYYVEKENLAIIPVSTYDHWFKKQLNCKTRNRIRKAAKNGVVIQKVPFSDEIVEGIMGIYNEIPVRQGRRFWHYGKDFETIKKENSSFLDRSDFICAYYDNEMIGFIKQVYTSTSAIIMQILSKVKHRDKAPTNALIAKSVELCAEKNVPNLIYSRLEFGNKGIDTLADFKRRNGFQKVEVPRYYVPLTNKGKLVLKFKLHRDISEILPRPVITFYRDLRSKWYN